MNISVIIPALNEEKALPRVLADLQCTLRAHSGAPLHIERFEIIVADNGSTDRTAELARAAAVKVLMASRKGYGSACLAGLAALPAETDVVLFMDGDYSDYAGDIPRLLEPIRKGEADFVLGERVTLGEAALSVQQRFGNALACTLMKLVYGHLYRDLGPFRAIRRSSLESLRMQDPGFGWTIEMQIKAIKKGLKIQEVPVRYRPRMGQSKISGTLMGSVRAGKAILGAIVKYYR